MAIRTGHEEAAKSGKIPTFLAPDLALDLALDLLFLLICNNFSGMLNHSGGILKRCQQSQIDGKQHGRRRKEAEG